MMKIHSLTLIVTGLTLLLSACSSHKVVDPNSDLKKNDGWVEKLPVAAGKSIVQVAPTQRIHVIKVKELRKKGDSWWLSAEGFARVNNEIMPYFWKSPKAPNLEITFTLKDTGKFETCRKTLEAGFTSDQVFEIFGEGDFAARMVNGKYLGVFRIQVIRECELLAKDSYSYVN